MSLITVITINYNNLPGLQKTMQSVAEQDHHELEYIVIDGGSTDGSVEAIKQCEAINSWISEADGGIYDAQNKGLLKARGEYLLFLNSGDTLVDHQVLKRVNDYLTTGKSFYYGNLIFSKDGHHEKHMAPEVIDLDFLLNSSFWHPCVFIKSTLFKKYGLYNSSFKITGDYEFFIRCLLKPGISTQYIDEFISIFDGSGISNNSAFKDAQTAEREKAWKLNTSDIVYESLKKYNSFSRSKYATLINSVQKLRGNQSF